jgi:UDP-N-acetylglucosamine 1-carboxyvinyltransferase
MDKFIIKGPATLKGEVTISGSKNAALPIITAALLAKGKFVFTNVPDLHDIKTMLSVLAGLGAKYTFRSNTLELDTTGFKFHKAPYELVKTMRASIYVMGPLLAVLKKAEVALPGGCAIGVRPIDIHLKGFEKLGAKITLDKGFVIAHCNQLRGCEIYFDKVSVGATANILMAAVLAKGQTKIFNAAMEPEITDLIRFLRKMGAHIEGENSNILCIKGVKRLRPANYEIIPDRIEAGTFLLAAAATRSTLHLRKLENEHLKNLYVVLDKMGVKYELPNSHTAVIHKSTMLKPVDVSTAPYPGFATDLQAQLTAVLATVKGRSVINETIFENRFMHILELNRMGANIQHDEHLAFVTGVKQLTGAPVMASDLRAGAAMVIAALTAKGETLIDRVYHLDRGYERLEKKLQKLGVRIERVRSKN